MPDSDAVNENSRRDGQPHPGSDDMEPTKRDLVPPTEAITGGFSRGTDLFTYIAAGLLIGALFDWLLGSWPLMTIGWSLIAIGYGWYKLWRLSAEIVDEIEKHSHGA